MIGSVMTLPGDVAASPFGNFHPYEGTWDSTIALWDGGYQPTGGVPAHGAVLPNLLRDRAAAVSGLTAAQCDLVVHSDVGASLAAERTTKGGLHVASTQAGDQAAAAGFAICPSQDLANWLLSQTDAGADYAVMLTAWFEITRPLIANAASQAPAAICNSASSTANYLFMSTGGIVSGAGSILPSNGQGLNMTQPAGTRGVLAVASNQWTGTKPSNLNLAYQRFLANVGAFGAWASFNLNKSYSAIIYRAQLDLVDLSDIAGATTAIKAAAMLAKHNAMIARDFASGGRFNGDTFTAAATLKP